MIEIKRDPGSDRFQRTLRERRPLRLPAGRTLGARSCICSTSSPRSCRPAPTRCLMPVMPAEFYKENEDRASETLECLLEPSWGKPASVVTAVRWGSPVEAIVSLRGGSSDRPDRHRHPRPDRPEPCPAGLGRRAHRPRGPLPGPDDSRFPPRRVRQRRRSLKRAFQLASAMRRMIYRGPKIDLALQSQVLADGTTPRRRSSSIAGPLRWCQW